LAEAPPKAVSNLGGWKWTKVFVLLWYFPLFFFTVQCNATTTSQWKKYSKINPKRKEEWQQKSKGEKVVVAGACHSLPAPFLVIRYV
jgi:hypothetical protein